MIKKEEEKMDNNTLVNVYFCQVIDEVNINTKMFFFLLSEYQICKTIGDGERAEPEKRTKSYNEVLNIVHIKEGVYFILHSLCFVKLDSCIFLLLNQ